MSYNGTSKLKPENEFLKIDKTASIEEQNEQYLSKGRQKAVQLLGFDTNKLIKDPNMRGQTKEGYLLEVKSFDKSNNLKRNHSMDHENRESNFVFLYQNGDNRPEGKKVPLNKIPVREEYQMVGQSMIRNKMHNDVDYYDNDQIYERNLYHPQLSKIHSMPVDNYKVQDMGGDNGYAMRYPSQNEPYQPHQEDFRYGYGVQQTYINDGKYRLEMIDQDPHKMSSSNYWNSDLRQTDDRIYQGQIEDQKEMLNFTYQNSMHQMMLPSISQLTKEHNFSNK